MKNERFVDFRCLVDMILIMECIKNLGLKYVCIMYVCFFLIKRFKKKKRKD